MNNSPTYQAYLKSPYKSGKHSTYFETYDELFAPYRGKQITFVEVGILGGGSLFMWREFFGPQARIIGIDLNPNAKKWEQHGFEIFIGSQSDENFWKNFANQVGEIDIVLDDGGHTYIQQVVTTEMLLPFIKDRGMVVVEDTHTSYMTGFGPQQYSFINYVKHMIDRINHRFAGIEASHSEKRVWSIQVFESIVAFRINKEATALTSHPTTNNGIDDLATDYRHHGDQRIAKLDESISKFPLLMKVPGFKFVEKKLRKFLDRRKISVSSPQKYFK